MGMLDDEWNRLMDRAVKKMFIDDYARPATIVGRRWHVERQIVNSAVK